MDTMMLLAVAVLVILGFSRQLTRWMWSKSEAEEVRWLDPVEGPRVRVKSAESLTDAQVWSRDFERVMEGTGVDCTGCHRGRFSGNLWAEPECPQHGYQTEKWWSPNLK